MLTWRVHVNSTRERVRHRAIRQVVTIGVLSLLNLEHIVHVVSLSLVGSYHFLPVLPPVLQREKARGRDQQARQSEIKKRDRAGRKGGKR
jgi:hypothetical protein